MKAIVKLIDWVLFTSLFAATCATGMCMATEKLLLNSTPVSITSLHLFIFGSTLVVYNLHFLLRSREGNHTKHWSANYKFWHSIFIVAGSLMVLYAAMFLSVAILQWCLVLGLLSFMYSLPLLPFLKKSRLKDYGWGKIIILVAVWTIATGILPIVYLHQSIADYPFEVVIRASLLFALCIAFDVRDMRGDALNSIRTIPNTIGAGRSYVLIDISLFIFLLSSIIQYIRYPLPMRLVAEIATVLVAKLVMIYIRKHPSDRAYLGLVDGVMLLYAVLILTN